MNSFPKRFPFASALLMTLAGALPLVGSSDADAAGNAAFESPSPVESEPILPRNRETPHIVHGTAAAPKQFPFMAGIIDVDTGKIICGATLIAPRFVLTAARCVAELDVTKLKVLLGDTDRSTATEAPTVKRAVSTVVIHENFVHDKDNEFIHHDIALLKLKEPAPSNLYIHPISLPQFNERISLSNKAVILGWGSTERFSNVAPTVLQSLAVQIGPWRDCESALTSLKFHKKTMLCTTAPPGQSVEQLGGGGIHDAGGPLVIEIDGEWKLHGIISFFFTSGVLPIVYTSVTTFRPWVEKGMDLLAD